jgi:hypothetical protein
MSAGARWPWSSRYSTADKNTTPVGATPNYPLRLPGRRDRLAASRGHIAAARRGPEAAAEVPSDSGEAVPGCLEDTPDLPIRQFYRKSLAAWFLFFTPSVW